MSSVPDAITAARVKSYLGIPASLTMHDVFIGFLISSKTQIVAEMFNLPCGLTANTYNDTLDVEDAWAINVRLPRYPVASIGAVTNSGSAIDVADTYIKSDRWLRLKDSASYFTQGRQKLQVNYVAGWNTIPAYVEDAITLSVCESFNKAPKTGILSEKIGAYAVSLAKNPGGGPSLGDAANALLNMHVSPVVPR